MQMREKIVSWQRLGSYEAIGEEIANQSDEKLSRRIGVEIEE